MHQQMQAQTSELKRTKSQMTEVDDDLRLDLSKFCAEAAADLQSRDETEGCTSNECVGCSFATQTGRCET